MMIAIPRLPLARPHAAFRATLLLAALAPLAAPAATVRNLCAPHVVARDVVVTAQQRRAAGDRVTPPSLIDPVNGFAWPDTQIGVVRSRDGKTMLFFASDGGCHARCTSVTQRDGSITRTVGGLDNPLGGGRPVENLIEGGGVDPPIDYVGAGPVFRVPDGQEGAGALLIVYHAERATYFPPHSYPDPLQYQNSFYSSLGLAKSIDDGLTWTDLGEIIRANQPYTPSVAGYDIGDGNLVVDPSGAYLYIYFPDRIASGRSDTFMSVARAPMRAVLDAAFGAGPRPAFTKYDHGRWDQPGIGGLSSGVLPGPYPSYAGDPGIAFDDALGRYVAIFDDTQDISWAESPDGIHWADPVLLQKTDPTEASALYAVPVGMGDDPSRLGKTSYVFYTYYPNPTNPMITHPGWQGAQVRRLTIDCAKS